MNDSPAQILREHLIQAGLIEDENGATWPSYFDHMPSGKDKQEVVSIHNAVGLKDGRLMTGEEIEHPGIQIRVRARAYATGYQKLSAIADELSNISQRLLVMSAISSYNISSVSRTSPVLPLGVEPETRCHLFSLNCLATITSL